jgi:hypothetical protein
MELSSKSLQKKGPFLNNNFMKKTTLSLTLSTLITLSSTAQALELLVVDNYQEAETSEIWKKAKTDQVPAALLTNVSMNNPASSYASIFPKTFFQESLFVVCHKNCNDKDIFKINGDQIDSRDRTNWNVVEQTNVYYWLTKYFSFLDERINFRPDQFLKVMTNRELRDETKGKKLTNNAFFSPDNMSLSFLPATNNLLFKLMGGKINRSGFDPSVVTHEASHYLFHHLFPNAVNEEIDGLNEGFADYMANIFLNSPKIGLVMMQGQSMRDSSSQIDKSGRIKSYEPGMEVHALGERVAYALWKSRELSSNKEELDRLLIDAVSDLGKNSYASVHDFKVKMLERLPQVIDSANMSTVQTIWETALAGNPNKIHNTAFLDKPMNDKPILGFKTKQALPETLAKEYGISAVTESNFSILQMENISATQIAILLGIETESGATPYWIALDAQRGNVLGAFGADKNLVTESEKIKGIKLLANQAKGIPALMKDFNDKTKAIADLSQGKGEFNVAFKVKDKNISSANFSFNGTVQSGSKLTMNLKRKLLVGLLGVPEIESVELFLLPVKTSLPQLDGQSVIGYKLQLKTGAATEVIIDKMDIK